MPPISLVIASSNSGKVREFSLLLKNFPLIIKFQPEGININENGRTFAENARIKALAVASATGDWSLADDSGLSVIELSGAPGIHSARYANTDSERISKLLSEMENCNNRKAFFTCAICIASPANEILLEVEAKCEGLITYSPRGNKGFGYDPIFEVDNKGLTFAEMTKDMKKACGHRGKAFSLLEPLLRELLESI